MRSAFEKRPEPNPIFQLDHANTALFLDFDGVIAEIADHPSEVAVEKDVIENLGRLSLALGNALAIVSGREISQLDSFLSPLRLPSAGVHGAERRDTAGRLFRQEVNADAYSRLRHAVREFAAGRKGLFAELKFGSVALHFRSRPDLADECLRFVESLKPGFDDSRIVHGKMVVEMKLANRNKADAVTEFLREKPFFRRKPVVFGDDVTDEDAFRAVNALGGISVKVGDGPTSATCRLASPSEFRAWLASTAERWSGSSAQPAEGYK
ncbi:trehalose-phosphatase [Oricola thermophila]|uniref:Trehalose 6-phosphate phosphatase n=1 Tax=Oricola thermophila TaxID=2742145 RepID=A0A6N1VAU3_9HYPH|nr:trehalose-phosphatase [Oricola thermophila]QKV17778.1 trehalose-phosphatase [Oricola thermophila]